MLILWTQPEAGFAGAVVGLGQYLRFSTNKTSVLEIATRTANVRNKNSFPFQRQRNKTISFNNFRAFRR